MHRFRNMLPLFAMTMMASISAARVVAQVQAGYTATTPVLNTPGQSKGAKGNPPSSLTLVPEDFSKLILAPGFLLNLQVYDMPEISSELRVDDKGDVAVPLSGAVHVAGLTLPQAQDAIRQRLISKQILLDPKINLDVVQYAGNNITVLGEVTSPGRLQLLAPHTLDDVLAMAGGETQLAGSTILITHLSDGKADTRHVHYDRNQKVRDDADPIIVEPGDTVLVPRAGIIYVLGGVNKPGGYVMQENGTLNVAEAISVASGTTMDAAVGSIRVVRKNQDGSLQTIPVSYRKITAGKEVAMQLHDGDILYVPISKLKSVLTAGITAGTSTALIYAVH